MSHTNAFCKYVAIRYIMFISTTHSRVNRLKISVFDIKAPEYVYFIKTYTETAISSIL